MIKTNLSNILISNAYANELGDIGNYENDAGGDGFADGWTKSATGTPAISTSIFVFGKQSQRIIGTGATNYFYKAYATVSGEYYFLSTYLYSDDLATYLSYDGGTTKQTLSILNSWERIGMKFSGTGASRNLLINTANTKTMYVDGTMLVKISASEYNTLSVSDLLNKYRYIDNTKQSSFSKTLAT